MKVTVALNRSDFKLYTVEGSYPVELCHLVLWLCPCTKCVSWHWLACNFVRERCVSGLSKNFNTGFFSNFFIELFSKSGMMIYGALHCQVHLGGDSSVVRAPDS